MTQSALAPSSSRPPWLAQSRSGQLQILLHVQPAAKRTAVAGEYGSRLKIALAAPPVDGKANAALIKFVAERLRLPKSKVRLVAGEASREKRLEVDGLAEAELLAAFCAQKPR